MTTDSTARPARALGIENLIPATLCGFTKPAPGVRQYCDLYYLSFDPLPVLAIAAFIAIVWMAAAFLPDQARGQAGPADRPSALLNEV